MEFNVETWGDFRIGKLFPVLQNGKANQGMLEEGMGCFYVGAKKDNNGVMLHCAYDERLVQKGNCIIFICNGQGSVGYANYMDRDFIGTTDIVAGYNDHLNCYNGLFIVTILCQERPKYSFGRKWKTHLKDTLIKLPQTDEGLPDWDFMEEYIKSLNYKPISTENQANKNPEMGISCWADFRFGDLISEIYKARAINRDDLLDGEVGGNSIRYITRTAENNGCECLADLEDINSAYIEQGNAISIGDTTATCFYQPEPFITGDHMVVVRADWLNKYNAMFIVTVLSKEQYKYSYGRAFLIDRIKNTIVKLPAKHNSDGTYFFDGSYKYSKEGYVPDWQFMESYIRGLPYGDRI